MPNYQILYIPGLGKIYDTPRQAALMLWRLWGIKGSLVIIDWYDGKSLEDKLARIHTAVGQVQGKNVRLVLVGESAGASLALAAAATIPDIYKIILIAGVNSADLPISAHIKAKAPALEQASRNLTQAVRSIDTGKIHTVRALVDRVVSPRFDTIPGAKTHLFWTVGHFFTIVLCLTFLSPLIIRIIRISRR